MKPVTLTDTQSKRLLAGERVEVRLAVKPGDPSWTYSTIDDDGLGGPAWLWEADEAGDWSPAMCPFGKPGDVLWVREACRAEELADGTDVVRYRSDDQCVVIENTEQASERWLQLLWSRVLLPAQPGSVGYWIPPQNMPRWACRMYARCVKVRVDTSGERAEWVGVFEKCEVSE